MTPSLAVETREIVDGLVADFDRAGNIVGFNNTSVKLDPAKVGVVVFACEAGA